MPANVVRDPEHLWQRVRDGLPAAVIGRLPECSSELQLVCFGCEAADERDPLVILRRVLLALLGEVEAAKKPTRSRAKKVAEPAADEVLAELFDRVAQAATTVIVLGGVEAAAPEVRATLVQLIGRTDGSKLPVIFRVAAEDAASELLAAVRGRGGEEAVVRREALTAAALRRLPGDVVAVLRAGAWLGGEFLLGDVGKLLGCEVLEVLERLQTAVDLGVEVEDRGGLRFALAEELVAGLAGSLMPALAQAWDERLAWLKEVAAAPVAVEPVAVRVAPVVVPEVPVVVVPAVESAALATADAPGVPVVVVPEVVLVAPAVELAAVAPVELPEWVTEVAEDVPVAAGAESVRHEVVEEVAASAGEPAAEESERHEAVEEAAVSADDVEVGERERREVATGAGEAAVGESERHEMSEEVATSTAAGEGSQRRDEVEDVVVSAGEAGGAESERGDEGEEVAAGATAGAESERGDEGEEVAGSAGEAGGAESERRDEGEEVAVSAGVEGERRDEGGEVVVSVGEAAGAEGERRDEGEEVAASDEAAASAVEESERDEVASAESERRDEVEEVASSAVEESERGEVEAADEESERGEVAANVTAANSDAESERDEVAANVVEPAGEESERRDEAAAVEAAAAAEDVAVVPAVVDDGAASSSDPGVLAEVAVRGGESSEVAVPAVVDDGAANSSDPGVLAEVAVSGSDSSAAVEAPVEVAASAVESGASRAEDAVVAAAAAEGSEAGVDEDMSEETAVSDEELVDGDLEEVPEPSWQAGEMFVRGRRRPGSGASPPRLRPKPPRIASLKARAEDKAGKGSAKLPTRNPALEVAARLKNVPQPMEAPEVAEAKVAEDSRKAGDPLAAAEHYTRAAHEAAEMGAPKVALGHVQQALTLLQGLPRTPERRRIRGEALLELGQLQWQSSAPELGFSLAQALTTLEAAAAELGPTAPTAVAVQLCQAIAGVCFERGDAKSLVRALQELASASRMLLAEGDQAGAARLLNDQAAVLVRMGDPVQALHLLRESRKVFQARSEEDPVALRELAETDHLFARLPLHAEMRAGRELEGYRAGLSHAQKAERAYRQLGDARELGRVWESMGRLELKMEQLEMATKHLESAVDVQMQLGDLTGLARSTEALSEVLGLRGRDGEAINLLRESVQFNRNKGSPLGLSINRRVFTALAERLRAHPLHAPALHEIEVLLDAGERELGTVDGTISD